MVFRASRPGRGQGSVDEYEVGTLAAVLERLSDDEDLRSRMGEAARDYARREHDLELVADRYVAALEEVSGRPAVRDDVLGEVARSANEVGGPSSNDGELAEMLRGCERSTRAIDSSPGERPRLVFLAFGVLDPDPRDPVGET